MPPSTPPPASWPAWGPPTAGWPWPRHSPHERLEKPGKRAVRHPAGPTPTGEVMRATERVVRDLGRRSGRARAALADAAGGVLANQARRDRAVRSLTPTTGPDPIARHLAADPVLPAGSGYG